MTDTQIEYLRYAYAALSMLCSTGFIATLVMRWEKLHPGERVLRSGLVVEHLVISYAAYVAIKLDAPTSLVSLLLVVSLAVIVSGFFIWLSDEFRNRTVTHTCPVCGVGPPPPRPPTPNERHTMTTIRKALLAAGFAAALALGTAMLDGDLSLGEALASAGAGLVTGAGTYQIPNEQVSNRRSASRPH